MNMHDASLLRSPPLLLWYRKLAAHMQCVPPAHIGQVLIGAEQWSFEFESMEG